MIEENVPNPPSAINKIKKLKDEIKGLKGRFESVEKKIHRGSEPSTKRWFVLAKYRKTNEWIQFGTYDTSVEVNVAVNSLKDEIRNRRGKFSQYYVTTNERELAKFVRGQRYREREYHKKMQEELQGVPLSRYTENIKAGTEIKEPKQVSKTLEQYSGYSGKPSGMMPRMSIGAWGSLSQPRKTNLPSFGAPEKTKPRKQKLILSHEEYQSYLDSGYTEQQLSDMGIFDKRSRFYQESSPFGGVPYRPISLHNSFVKPIPLKSPYQKRIEENLPYELFKPDVVGTLDEFGERKTNFRPKRISL